MKKKNLIRLSKSCLKANEKKAVLRVLDKEFLGMGEEVLTFEQDLSNFFERETICVVNGTAALHLALQACGINQGDEVIIPSITYLASFQAISATGATPIACEVDEDTLCLDCSDAENKITKRTKAIMPVHYSGGVGDLSQVYALAKKHKLRVVEDAAHAFGTTYKGQKVGSFGDIACFSFDGIKNITSGEGGCIVTNDKNIIHLVKDARLLGVHKDSEKRYENKRSWRFEVLQQGWRYHMSNIMAAIGIEQLKRFDQISTKRRKLAKHYVNLLKDEKLIQLIKHDYQEIVPHIFVIKLKTIKLKEFLQKKLEEENIQTGVHYYPNHLHKYYRKNRKIKLKKTEFIYKKLMTLPLHEDLTLNEAEYIVSKIKKNVNNYDK